MKNWRYCLLILIVFVYLVLPVSADMLNGYYRVAPNIQQGATVFIGEQGLNITAALNSANAAGVPSAYTTIGWWYSVSDMYSFPPIVSVNTTGRATSFTVNQSEFDNFEGPWYLVASDQRAKPNTGAVLNVKAPKLDVTIRDPNQNDGADVSGKSVPAGSQLQFKIDTNMYPALDFAIRGPVYNTAGSGANTDGYLDIVVKTDSGAILTALYNTSGSSNSIQALNVSVQPFVWGRSANGAGTGAGSVLYVWDTAALIQGTNEKAYPGGTYTVSVVSKLNNMNNNYLSGAAAYTGRTVSETKTITLIRTSKIGIFRPSSGIWSLDSNGNLAWEGSDTSLSWGLPGDIPVIGDWNGDGKDGIGIFRSSSGIWSLDSNENFAWEPSDVSLSWGLPGDVPIVGDWNADGKDEIGIFRPSSGIWSLDSNGNFAWEGSDTSLSWGLPNDKPVVGKY